MNWPVEVLVVDDSIFSRRWLTDILEADPQIRVVGYARNGREALEKAVILRPRVITLDLEMPVMDGLATLKALMETNPVAVIMLSAHTAAGAEVTIKALEMGAVDFVLKPVRPGDFRELARVLPEKIKAAALVPPARLCQGKPCREALPAPFISDRDGGGRYPGSGITAPGRPVAAVPAHPDGPLAGPPAGMPDRALRPAAGPGARSGFKAGSVATGSSAAGSSAPGFAPPAFVSGTDAPVAEQQRLQAEYGRAAVQYGQDPATPVTGFSASDLLHPTSVIAIGASTGGPAALRRLLAALPGDLPAGLVIVQHMPAGFTAPLARNLNELSALEVREADDGDVVRPGLALIAPAGQQMSLEQHGDGARVQLAETAEISTLFKPSVDVLMLSVARIYGHRSLGVILTGMGNDGVRGLRAIKDRGGYVLAQDEASAIVYGMPRAAVEAGVVDRVVPLEHMAAAIMAAVGYGRGKS